MPKFRIDHFTICTVKWSTILHLHFTVLREHFTRCYLEHFTAFYGHFTARAMHFTVTPPINRG